MPLFDYSLVGFRNEHSFFDNLLNYLRWSIGHPVITDAHVCPMQIADMRRRMLAAVTSHIEPSLPSGISTAQGVVDAMAMVREKLEYRLDSVVDGSTAEGKAYDPLPDMIDAEINLYAFDAGSLYGVQLLNEGEVNAYALEQMATYIGDCVEHVLARYDSYVTVICDLLTATGFEVN